MHKGGSQQETLHLPFPHQFSPLGQAKAYPEAANTISPMSQYLLCTYIVRRKIQFYKQVGK